MQLLIWLLPIMSGLADALSRGVIKFTKVHRFTLVAAGYIFALPFYMPLLWAESMPEVKPMFWVVLAAHVPLLIIAQVMTVEAHRLSPLILTAPYLSLTTVFLLVTSPFMGGGSPNLWGAISVFVLTSGLYFLNTKDGKQSLFEPFRQLRQERGSRLMIVVSAIFAVTANLDYLALQNANASFYLLVDHGVAGGLCAFLALGYASTGRAPMHEIRPRSWWPLLLYGVVIAASVVPHMLAFWWIPLVPYVIAGKRAGAILFSVALGLVIAALPRFKSRHADERANLKWRLIGVALVILGMLGIIFLGKN